MTHRDHDPAPAERYRRRGRLLRATERLAAAAEAAPALAKAFAALGDPVRLRLMSLLMTADGGEICACDLVEPVGKSQPTVSHHLKVLRDAGLVTATRRGTNIWYAAAPDQVAALRASLAPAQ